MERRFEQLGILLLERRLRSGDWLRRWQLRPGLQPGLCAALLPLDLAALFGLVSLVCTGLARVLQLLLFLLRAGLAGLFELRTGLAILGVLVQLGRMLVVESM